ncbi:MAG: GntR family transcriptional regulator [Kiritimatiellae bacterium]|nr:GntR family transcriptional regulator [Kiritimatiellia bacterium]
MPTSFVNELNRLPPLRVPHRTACKHTQIRQRIECCVHGLAPETRLPTLRELSALLGATPQTVWRAVEALVEEGVLHTREKSGIFVSQLPGTVKAHEAAAGVEANSRTLTISTHEVLPHQRRFWRETLEAFHREHRLIHLRLGDSAVPRSALAPMCDLMAEYLPRSGASSVPESSLLDLEHLMGANATRPCLRHVLPARASRFVPFQLTVPCLFINLKWAKENRLRRSEFTGFSDQCAYIDACLERISDRPAASSARLNSHMPSVWLGRRALDIVALTRSADARAAAADLGALVRDTETVLRVWTRVNSAAGSRLQRLPLIDGFLEGHAAFFFGFSYDIGTMEAGAPDFPWQVVPLLAVDDRTPVFMQCLCVDARTPYPVECVRFIEHVLSPAGQQRLADCAQVPLDARRIETTSAASFQGVFSPEWKTLEERMAAIYPSDADGDYVYQNIMVDDLYRCADGSVPAKEAVESMIGHAQAYLSHREAQHKQEG